MVSESPEGELSQISQSPVSDLQVKLLYKPLKAPSFINN